MFIVVHALLRREGILFSLAGFDTSDVNTPPPNISFMDVLAEFTSKLIKQDKRSV